MWSDSIDFTSVSFSSNHILGSIKDNENQAKWFMSGIYGWTESMHKWRTWHLLDQLNQNIDGPWICYGDFNEILGSNEKDGGATPSLQAMDLFWQAINRASLVDLKFTGHRFTWTNCRK